MRKPLLVAAAAVALTTSCAATVAVADSQRAATTVLKTRSVLALRVVVDSTGYTLYTWASGRNDYGSAHNDPNYRPMIADGRVVAAPGSKINGNKLRTRRLPNGRRQVTYHHQPLYLYKGTPSPARRTARTRNPETAPGSSFNTTAAPLPRRTRSLGAFALLVRRADADDVPCQMAALQRGDEPRAGVEL
jgi:predicted lipoprotein with Yx(FWY)xxD motif